MCENGVSSDDALIDISGLSLRDVDKIEASSLAQAIQLLLHPVNDEEIRSFSSRI
jgi:hypothetical protein